MFIPSPADPVPSRARRDVRIRALTITATATVALGVALAWGPQAASKLGAPDLRFDQIFDLRAATRDPDEQRVRARFDQGVAMLHMREYEYAMVAFHEVLSVVPDLPEAHVNMGFALLGLGHWEQARSFFESATDLRRDQINAYYGLAVALEELGDVQGAIGAMESYVHRAPPDDPYRPRAEAALWEWRTGGKEKAVEEPATAAGG